MNETKVVEPKPLVPPAEELEPEEAIAISQGLIILRRFLRHKLGMIGLALIVIFLLISLFGDFISPYNFAQTHKFFPFVPPTSIHFISKDGQVSWPFVYGIGRQFDQKALRQRYVEKDQIYPIRFWVHGEPYRLLGIFPTDVHLLGLDGVDPNDDRGPGRIFLFGTDSIGRDIFSRTLVGGKFSLTMGMIVILLSFALGVPLGGLSGFYGRWVDTLIQKGTETFLAVPRLALTLALVTALPGGDSAPMLRFAGIALILALVSWAPLTRVVRGQFLSLREADFVLAAKALGSSDWRLIMRHILPNTVSFLVVSATLTMPNVIIAESTLSFLGYGIQDPLTSWGALLQDAQKVQNIMFYPWELIPGALIVLAVLAFNFMGDALRDAVDPFTVSEVKQKE